MKNGNKAAEPGGAAPFDGNAAAGISLKLRKIVMRLSAQDHALAQATFEAITTQIEEYGSSAVRGAYEEVHEHCLMTVQVWYQALLRFSPPTEVELDAMRRIGARKCQFGLSLGGLLWALRIGSSLFWEQLIRAGQDDPEVASELLKKISPFFLHHFDRINQSYCRGFYEEQRRLVRWRDRLRSDLSDVIFSHPEDRAAFDEYALALGLDASVPHIAVALRPQPGGNSSLSAGAEFDELTQKVAEVVGLPVDNLLHAKRYRHVLLWLPISDSDSVSSERLIVEQCRSLLDKAATLSAVGIGLPDVGPHGFRRSADQAIRAVELGTRSRRRERIHRYVQCAIYDLAAQSAGFLRYGEYLVERLASDEIDLAETLQVYFDKGQQRKSAAAALNIHPNTLTYRLLRIEAIVGANLSDPGWIATLHAALSMRRTGTRKSFKGSDPSTS